MQVLDTIQSIRAAISVARKSDVGVGLVPTMGALHAGHLSLVERARAECGLVVASLFVNPTQFAPGEDFERYPRQPEQDSALFERAGVDLVFAPGVAEMYPEGESTFVDVGELGARLDGAHRPGHFRGVATVVSKLFHIIQPDRAFFGQKDAAQVAVLRRMVRDLNVPVEVIACPIVRDADGLALSSRNAYLSPAERSAALALPRTLQALTAEVRRGTCDRNALIKVGSEMLAQSPGVQPEYLEVVEADTLLPVDLVRPGILIAVAAKVGKTRLIDNVVV